MRVLLSRRCDLFHLKPREDSVHTCIHTHIDIPQNVLKRANTHTHTQPPHPRTHTQFPFRLAYDALRNVDILVTYHSRLPWSDFHARWLFPLAKHAGTRGALFELALLPPPLHAPAGVDAYIAPSSYVTSHPSVQAHRIPTFHVPPGTVCVCDFVC